MLFYVYHAPNLVPEDVQADCAVVVDVLRATTTMTTALEAHAEAIRTFKYGEVEPLFEESNQWPADKRILAGERGGHMVPGFDVGNSPLDMTSDRVESRRIFLSTTNGTHALQRVEKCPVVLACCFRNRQAVANVLLERKFKKVVIVASGWEGSYSLEDTACSGALIHAVLLGLDLDPTDTNQVEVVAGNDEAVAAVTMFEACKLNINRIVRTATHGRRLQGMGCELDLDFCAEMDCTQVVPAQTEPGLLKVFN